VDVLLSSLYQLPSALLFGFSYTYSRTEVLKQERHCGIRDCQTSVWSTSTHYVQTWSQLGKQHNWRERQRRRECTGTGVSSGMRGKRCACSGQEKGNCSTAEEDLSGHGAYVQLIFDWLGVLFGSPEQLIRAATGLMEVCGDLSRMLLSRVHCIFPST
jgi:hypothetical protein